ncbi:MAG: hypothetical protein OSJ73_23210, partial [Lachnospiraceae bacterium]|nr:hypothetical protein [Lachnospiraceae bacterium]
SAETFFLPFRSKSRITHNANNSEATERVRNLLGFTGFLGVQTFNSQGYFMKDYCEILFHLKRYCNIIEPAKNWDLEAN